MKEQNSETEEYNIPSHLNERDRKLWIGAVDVLDKNRVVKRPPDTNGTQELMRKGRERNEQYRQPRREPHEVFKAPVKKIA